MKLLFRFVPMLLITAFIGACATLGVQAPKTFEDRIATAYTSLTAARDVSVRLAENGKLSRDDFKDFMNQCDSAREAIEMARMINKTDATAGQERLDVALALLTALNAYLSKREAGPPTQPEVTGYENRRRPAGLHHPYRFTDEGSAAVYVAATGGQRGAHDQRRRFDSSGLGGRCGTSAAAAAA